MPIVKGKDLEKTLQNLEEHGRLACTLCNVVLRDRNWDWTLYYASPPDEATAWRHGFRWPTRVEGFVFVLCAGCNELPDAFDRVLEISGIH